MISQSLVFLFNFHVAELVRGLSGRRISMSLIMGETSLCMCDFAG